MLRASGFGRHASSVRPRALARGGKAGVLLRGAVTRASRKSITPMRALAAKVPPLNVRCLTRVVLETLLMETVNATNRDPSMPLLIHEEKLRKLT